MEITFYNSKLRKLCEQNNKAQQKLGENCARKLRSRLSDLEVAQSVGELVAGRPHPLDGNRAGQFAVDLADGKRLVFKPNDDPIPKKEDGSIDWLNVTKVCIVFIGDYHD